MAADTPPQNLLNILAHIPLFQSLTPEQLIEVGACCREQRLNRGDYLFHKGDIPSGFHVVVFGQIKLLVSSSSGDEKVVEIIGPQQSFGEAVMFLQRPYPVTAVALSDALLLHIDQGMVDQLLQSDPSFAKRMLGGLSFRLRSLVQDVESYSMRSSVQRVIGYLLQNLPDDSQDRLTIALPTSKLVIASRLNLTPETLSRVFAELNRLGLIAVHGRSIDIPKLQRLREFMG
jgi:CRP/FNR family transcriptional regulator, dissimilatory nitrate respiration regulator